MGGRCGYLWGRREINTKAMTWKPEGNSLLGRCEDDNKADLKETEWEGMDFMNQAYVWDNLPDVVKTVMEVLLP